MNRRDFLKSLSLSTAAITAGAFLSCQKNSINRPNIVYILADDLGYGDVGCLNPKSKIPTPNLDKLAGQGITFTDAHSGSAVCSPTRYGILTGRYAWRSRLQSGVLWTWDPPLIEKDRLTVPVYLKGKGYHTACIGKWHLGWDWPGKDGKPIEKAGAELGWNIDFSLPLKNGPTPGDLIIILVHVYRISRLIVILKMTERLASLPWRSHRPCLAFRD